MSSRDYPRLTVEDFGRKLIKSGDLDPIYIGLHDINLNEDQLPNWLVAYWCFYHAGFACFASEQTSDRAFWEVMMEAARNETPTPVGGRWPRGSERRHFRGQQGIRSIQDMIDKYGHDTHGCLSLVLDIAFPLGIDFIEQSNSAEKYRRPVGEIFERAQKLRGFGDWISFKIADMLDRCTSYSVEFDNAHIFMFSDPVKGAKLANAHWDYIFSGKQDDICNDVVSRLINEFSDLTAPPRHERPVNVQEVETVLCKWKSHLNGHYPLGKDTLEIAHGLAPWCPISETARRFHSSIASMEFYQENSHAA